ncbi:PQQ-binding-like beta-propeller repeat protein [Nannocystis sp. ncelm1]|uniref:PQQ-binding-like beta-propeller repeat protein n=2 Tax=Nannocystis radixulma TaxID=2995305 RepID=A0ABT5AZW9_9BACT|nr:PQQ-binding-like beta-propeller repeat protein [Nannocystis radixulma]
MCLATTLALGCPGSPGGDETTDGDPGTTTDAATTTSTGEDPGASETAPTTSDSTTAAPTTSGSPSGCGDGALGDGEACDDGNAIQGDGCNNDCQPSGELLAEFRSLVPGTEWIHDVAVTAGGDVIVAGQQGRDRWVAGFDAQLSPQWSQTYSETEWLEVASSVAVKDDAIFVVGSVHAEQPTNPSTAVRKTWIAQLGPTGEVVWEDAWISEFGDSYGTQIAATDDGDLVIAGFMSVSATSTGMFARRYTADGEVLWTASHSMAAEMHAIWPIGPGLAVTPEAVYVGFAVFGMSPSEETLVTFAPGDGAELWSRGLDSFGSSIKGAAAADAGELVVISSGGDPQKIFARRVTEDGDIAWTSNACTGTVGRAIAFDPSGDVVIIGDGPGDVGTNIRLCRFAPDGALKWGKDIDGGEDADLGYAVTIAPGGQIVAGGVMDGGASALDAWLAVYSP